MKSDLWILCEHGKFEKHVEAVGCPDHSRSFVVARTFADAPNVSCTVAHFVQCPGGHKATVEEVVEWLSEQPTNTKTLWREAMDPQDV